MTRPDLTQLLATAKAGDGASLEALAGEVYPELRRLAASRMRGEAPGRTMQPTALVHEAWMRLLGGDVEALPGDSRAFFAAASRSMQRILVEQARHRNAERRGGGAQPVTFHDLGVDTEDDHLDVIELNEALDQLDREDADLAQIVRLRYFAGLSPAQVAEQLDTSESSVFRRWRFARAWLLKRMGGAAE